MQFLALRPWSFTLSVLPIIAGAVALEKGGGGSVSILDTATLIGAVVSMHAAANLVNTITDFDADVDHVSSADDRTLVDSRLSRGSLFTLAIVCVASAIGCVIQLALASTAPSAATEVIALATVGLVIAVAYSGPCGLKFHSLGEIAVFLCFGPLLGAGTSVALVGSVQAVAVAAASPFGFVAVATLHANNTRDLLADQEAGVRTVAQRLPSWARSVFFAWAVWMAVATAALAMVLVRLGAQHPISIGWESPVSDMWGVVVRAAAVVSAAGPVRPPVLGPLLLAMCAPWALALVRRFGASELRTLPQQAAQWGALLGGALLGGLVDPRTAGRGLLSCLFGLGGINNILMWLHTSELVTAKLRAAFGVELPAWACQAAAAVATAGQIVASMTFVLGVEPCLSAAVLLAFLVPVTPVVHDMWSYSLSSEAVGTTKAAVAVVAPLPSGEERIAQLAPHVSGPASLTPRRSARVAASKRQHSLKTATAAVNSASTGKIDGSKFRSDQWAGVAPASALDAALPAGGGGVPTFLAPFDSEFVHFFKNIGMAGGLVIFLAYGSDDACNAWM